MCGESLIEGKEGRKEAGSCLKLFNGANISAFVKWTFNYVWEHIAHICEHKPLHMPKRFL